MKNSKSMLVWGVALIGIGVLFLINMFFDSGWALPIIGLGAIFMTAAFVFRMGAFAIPGVFIMGMGTLLYVQALSHNWVSWIYIWPIVPAFLGLSFLVANWMGVGKTQMRRIGSTFLAGGVLMILVCWFGYTIIPTPWFSWAWIIMGMGLIFLSVALVGQAGGFAVPGMVLLGTGGLLYWQNITRLWETWAYLWPIVILSVSLGLILLGVLGKNKHKVPRRVGVEMGVWAFIFLAIFAMFFMRGGEYVAYWPALLIATGIYMLIRNLFGQRKKQVSA